MSHTALMVGINYDKYPGGVATSQSGALGKLRYAEDDAREMASELEQAGYDVVTLLGEDASRRNILDALSGQRVAAGGDGLFLFHFAGHGGVENGVAYMMPIDSEPGALEATGLRMEDIVTRHLTDVDSAVALLDCCHSGSAIGVRDSAADAEAGARAFRDQMQQIVTRIGGTGRAIITACAGSELAYEDPDLKHGAFTYFALEHLRTSKDVVTTNSLFESIDKGLESKKLPAPVQGGSWQGRIVLRPGQADAIVAAAGGNLNPLEVKAHGTVSVKAYATATVVEAPSENAEIEQRILSHLLPQFEAFQARHEREQIITIGDRILRIDRNHEPTKSVTRDARVSRGNSHLQNSQPEGAITDFTRAIELDPENPQHYRSRAQAHTQRGEYAKASADLTQAINLHTNSEAPADYYYDRGASRYLLQEYKEAIDDLRRAIRLDSVQAHYHTKLGMAYKASGDIQRANRTFDYAVALGDASAEKEIER